MFQLKFSFSHLGFERAAAVCNRRTVTLAIYKRGILVSFSASKCRSFLIYLPFSIYLIYPFKFGRFWSTCYRVGHRRLDRPRDEH